mgnify:CR=1 FL=1
MNSHLLKVAIEASLKAGEEILNVYKSDDFDVHVKSDDSPLTRADLAAHNIIKAYLTKTGYPILSEEGRGVPYNERMDWAYLWLVDPLDGTKEFIKRNGEFTVNIAFIRNHVPMLGVVYAPFIRQLYFADSNIGAFKFLFKEDEVFSETLIETIINNAEKLPLKQPERSFTVVGSRSHMSAETEEYIQKMRKEYGNVEMISKGSALKLCMVAEGAADVYPRFAPTMEWDTGAGHAIVNFSGGTVQRHDVDLPLEYNKENLTNPWFIAKR